MPAPLARALSAVSWVLLVANAAGPPPGPLVFSDLSLKDLNAGTVALESPFAMVASAKEAYGLAEVHDGDVTCSPLLARITDWASLQADVQRPQVILSGEIHGDERVVRRSKLLLCVTQCYPP